MSDNLFTETEINELRDLIKDEHGAFWRTGDWLVRKIDMRIPGDTQATWNSNGRDEVIKNAAQRSDAKESTLKERYLTSRCFPANRRYTNLSWTLHRRFMNQGGYDKAADWMDEFVATGADTTIREAATWMEQHKDKKSNAGQESAKAIAKSITVVSDPETKAKEVVRQIKDQKVREAILSEVLTEEVRQEAATAYLKAHPEVAVAATEDAGYAVFRQTDQETEEKMRQAGRRTVRDLDAHEDADKDRDTEMLAEVSLIAQKLATWRTRAWRVTGLNRVRDLVADELDLAVGAESLTPEMFG